MDHVIAIVYRVVWWQDQSWPRWVGAGYVDLLTSVYMRDCKATSTSISNIEKLSTRVGDLLEPEDSTKCMSTVGALRFLTLTRFDIASF